MHEDTQQPSSEDLLRALAAPVAYGAGAPAVEVLQTHISMLFLVGERVYKVKKAVDLGFLDFSAPEKRRRVCEEEVRLNRRLAPATYLGVAPVLRDAAGTLRMGEVGVTSAANGDTIVDWAVVMRRLPRERMLDTLLEEDQVDAALLDAVVRLLVDFHRDAARGPEVDRLGGYASAAANARENFVQLAPFAASLEVTALLGFLQARTERFLRDRRELFLEREAQGRIVEGHGDLHAGNICFTDDGIVVYDCIEFSPRYRCGDVAADIAFLVMDLDARGASELSRDLLQRYERAADDRGLRAIVRFYQGYRAVVRAKVAAIASSEREVPAAQREAKRLEARRYLHLAARYELAPGLVLVSGLPTSGKSAIASHLAQVLDAELLRSDVRHEGLHGVEPSACSSAGNRRGLYSRESKEQTYDSLRASCAVALAARRSVVVDASFPSRALRGSFLAVAEGLGLPHLVVHVTATDAETRERMAARADDAEERSDAGPAVWAAARGELEAPNEWEGQQVVVGARPLELETTALLARWVAEFGGAPL